MRFRSFAGCCASVARAGQSRPPTRRGFPCPPVWRFIGQTWPVSQAYNTMFRQWPFCKVIKMPCQRTPLHSVTRNCLRWMLPGPLRPRYVSFSVLWDYNRLPRGRADIITCFGATCFVFASTLMQTPTTLHALTVSRRRRHRVETLRFD